MGLSRLALSGGLGLGSRVIPKGTIISINPWVVHNPKELWDEDTNQFNPDRWLDHRVTNLDKHFISVRNVIRSWLID
jgi:cytochrome P450